MFLVFKNTLISFRAISPIYTQLLVPFLKFLNANSGTISNYTHTHICVLFYETGSVYVDKVDLEL